ncbi:MAG: hypothetical protein HZB38_19075 [Planctomycetes bacterium]|nr:hypothetical protein [Planctomycetota bacterium]
MTARRARLGFWIVSAILLIAAGCAGRKAVIDAFPVGAMASPWILDAAPWSGTFDQAASALGDDASGWRTFSPNHVWLGSYHHESRARNRLTARIFSFDNADAASRAFEHFRPPLAKEFKAGDGGCWTDDGVTFRWGKLVVEVFGSNPNEVSIPEQAVYLVAFIEKRMAADLPENPK